MGLGQFGRNRRRGLAASVLTAGLVLVSFGFSAGAAEAISPPTAAASACGSVLLSGGSWLAGGGVDVKSNGIYQGQGTSCGGSVQNTVNGVRSGYEWQCVELVNRLYLTKGWIHTTWAGNGGRSAPSTLDSMYDLAPAGLTKQPNGSITYLAPGDVVSVNEYLGGNFVQDGHVLIVNATGTVAGGTVPLVSQNGATVTRNATLSGGTLSLGSSGSYSYSVIGVIHAPGGGNSVAATPTADGHIQLFTIGDGSLHQNWYSPSNGGHGSWVAKGAPVSLTGTPALVARAGQQVIDAFVRGTAGQVYETWYNWGTGKWGGWIGIGGSVTSDLQSLPTSDGHDQLFATSSGAIVQNWFSPASGAIGGWISF